MIEGRIIRDNVYGTIEEDVWRRDFTCNALYYNIADFSIWDYTGGFEDVKNNASGVDWRSRQALAGRSRPMLRAVRFAGKLGFTIDDSVVEAMRGTPDCLPMCRPPACSMSF